MERKRKQRKKLSKSEMIVQKLSSEANLSAMNFTRDDPTEFVKYSYDEISLENDNEQCTKFSKKVRSNCPEVFWKGEKVFWKYEEKFAKQLYWNHNFVLMFSCKFVAYFQNIFLKGHLWMAASEAVWYVSIQKGIIANAFRWTVRFKLAICDSFIFH